MNHAPRTLLSVQYLRGLAALAVVTLHVLWFPVRGFPINVGAAGVDVFFVISGFIMVHASRREPTPGTFLAARARRVLPMCWLATLATAATTAGNAPWRVLAGLALWPTQDDNGRWMPVLGQGWTLTYEALFYLAFAAALLLPARHRLTALTAGLLLVCAAAALTAPASLGTFGISPMMFPEFLAGAWLHRIWQENRLPAAWVGWAMILAGAAAIIAQPDMLDNFLWRPLGWGVPALMIVAGGLTLENQGRLPRVPGLEALGAASYSLYLTHALTVGVVRTPLMTLPGAVAWPGIMGACVTVGLLTHHWIERPLTRLLQRGLHRAPVPVTAPRSH